MDLRTSNRTGSSPFDNPTPLPDPEDFYRSPSPASDSQYCHTSPTDSQAPIMGRSTSSQYAESVNASESSQPGENSYVPPPPIPEANDYRTSMGVINGEIGGVVSPVSPVRDTPAEPLSAGLPMSAGLKTPGTAKEEARVAELEQKAQKLDKKDLAIKLKIRLGKVVLRSVNCACSLVILALVASTFAIFYATRRLAPRNNLPPWAVDTPQWPQIVTLVIACISLILSFSIMFAYWKGGHNCAEKAALRATIFAAVVFLFTVIMWASVIGIMQNSRANMDGKDIWGWSCKDNTRKALFQDTINYTLVCRQQDWVVVCAIIEISVEFLTICLYVFAFWRIFHTKKQFRKSMNMRDEARASLWMARLREAKDLEEGPDSETSKNTAYNTLNATEITTEKDHTVPILQPAPLGNKRGSIANNGDAPISQPPAVATFSDSYAVPRSARSVSFQPPPPLGSAR